LLTEKYLVQLLPKDNNSIGDKQVLFENGFAMKRMASSSETGQGSLWIPGHRTDP
jgi:hypothetical protein